MSSFDRRTALKLALGAAAAPALAPATRALAQGQAWPARTVNVTMPFTSGGTADLFGRIFAQAMQEKYGKPFVVENRAGAGGTVGVAFASRSAPDGYTLLVGTVTTQSTAPSVYKKLPYNPDKDFQAISLFAALPNMLVVAPRMPVKTFPEFIDYVKANSGKLSYGESGYGSSSHLTAELLTKLTGVKLTRVPYRSSGDIMNALAGGHIDLAYDNITLAWPQAQGGQVGALAVTTKERSPTAPDIPAMAEFFPGFDIKTWHGLYAPAGLPRPLTEQIAADVKAIFSSEAVKTKLFDIGAVAQPMDSDASTNFTKAEAKKYEAMVKDIGIEPM